jgi:2-polyprenyl-3-methyl-5-hydroxy-6-metoxy-1,4-benzoquinol methylase
MRSGLNASYTKKDHVFRSEDPYARAKYGLTLRWLGSRLRPGAVLYNIGVGGGYFNQIAASAQGTRIVGCEPDAAAFAHAQESAPANCELVQSGLEEFAHDREPANIVVMHDVLEHIDDDRGAAQTVRRLLTDDGVAILSVPALMSLYGLHDEELGHFRRYTASSLRAVLEPHFVIERLRWFGMASIPIAWYFSRYRRSPYPAVQTSSAAGSVYAAVCELESHVPEPIGTSLIVQLRPRG